jgi:Prp8 binding protein
MPPVKRPAEDPAGQLVLVPQKKSRNEMMIVNNNARAVVESNIPRTSNMEAPIMMLTGHKGEVYTGKFHPEGSILASSGFDREIFLWNV